MPELAQQTWQLVAGSCLLGGLVIGWLLGRRGKLSAIASKLSLIEKRTRPIKQKDESA